MRLKLLIYIMFSGTTCGFVAHTGNGEGRPGARCTHGPRAIKKHAAEPQVQPKQPAFPAQWFYGLYVLSPVRPGFVVTVRATLEASSRPTMRKAHCAGAPAPGRRDHTISPSARP